MKMLSNRCSVSLLLLLVASAALCEAQRTKSANNGTMQNQHPKGLLLKPSDDLARATWIITGVIATTTMSVLIVLIPTVLYYKYVAPKGNTNDPIKF